VWREADVGEQDLDFAAVAGVDDSSGDSDALGGHGGAVADEQAKRVRSDGVASLNGDAGAQANGVVGEQFRAFKGKDVIAEVFSGMGDFGEAGSVSEQFYEQHSTILEHLREVRMPADMRRVSAAARWAKAWRAGRELPLLDGG